MAALFDAMRGELKAIAAYDRETAARYRAAIAQRLVDPTYQPRAQRQKGLTAEQAQKTLDNLISSWESLSAYYIDGVDLAAMRVEPATGTPVGQFFGLVPAEARGRRATLRVYLTRDEDGRYWAALMDFADSRNKGAAASAAASNGAAATSRRAGEN